MQVDDFSIVTIVECLAAGGDKPAHRESNYEHCDVTGSSLKNFQIRDKLRIALSRASCQVRSMSGCNEFALMLSIKRCEEPADYELMIFNLELFHRSH